MTQLREAGTADRKLFAGTAAYYARYRPPYPAAVFERLTEGFGLGHGTTVLDLGCGTGQLALPLSATGCEAWAMDPDPDMIGEGVRQQSLGGYGILRWVLGRAEDLRTAQLPRLRLCTMGSSFHWMDRELVLDLLDELIEPGGGVALVSGATSIWSRTGAVEGAWLDVTREVVTRFLGPERRAGQGTYAHPARSHAEILRGSPFGAIEERRFTSVRRMSVDDVMGLQLSTSYASPAQLGDRLPAFRAELTRRLEELNPGDGFETVEHTDLIVARRSANGTMR
jgi:ubiquinone/menaquinone biosynthesis C-methylase UbiE